MQSLPMTRVSVARAACAFQPRVLPNHTTTAFAAIRQQEFSTQAEFRSDKVRDLFERITSTCEKDDAKRLGDYLNNEVFGRPFLPNEFYYRGFGARRVSGAASSAPSPEEAQPVKVTVDLKLTGFDPKAKIKVIKEVRAIAALSLKEAKDLVEGAPKVIQKDLKPEQADEIKVKLEQVGATIELV